MNQLKDITVEVVEAHTYHSIEKPLNGHDIRGLMLDKHIFSENIARYLCRVSYPEQQGGIDTNEILHIGGTTVGLVYSNKDLNMPLVKIHVYGTDESIAATKSVLERLLNTYLERLE